jgi:hypothetical protein
MIDDDDDDDDDDNINISGNRIQIPKGCFEKYTGRCNKDRTISNVQKINICTNVPSSQTIRPYMIIGLQGCDTVRSGRSNLLPLITSILKIKAGSRKLELRSEGLVALTT